MNLAHRACGRLGLSYLKFSVLEGSPLPWTIYFDWNSVEKSGSLYVCLSWKRGWKFFRHWSYGRS